MKLRIQAGGIRLRLKQSEVRALVEGGEVVEMCPTLPVALQYALRPDTGVTDLAAEFDGGRLTVRIPAQWLIGWEGDERVGFASAGVLIEKDFKCAQPSAPADNEDCYENPVACG